MGSELTKHSPYCQQRSAIESIEGRMNNLAIVLFGSTCSGKTLVANHLENNFGFTVISKDRLIYQSDLMAAHGEHRSWEDLRQELVSGLTNQAIVLDEAVRLGRLSELQKKGYRLVGVQLPNNIEARQTRMTSRARRQQEILLELEVLVHLPLLSISREDRRKHWRNPSIRASLPVQQQPVFDSLLKEIYLSGSHFLKEENPNPACFAELQSVYTPPLGEALTWIEPERIASEAVPFENFLDAFLQKIKYCVWDIGGVIYGYDTAPLFQWLTKNSTIAEKIGKGEFSFNNYMLGYQTFDEMCESLCMAYGVPFSDYAVNSIRQLLWIGVGPTSDAVRRAMSTLADRGILNCVLSNALPELLQSGSYHDLVRPEHRFYSFDLHALKPATAAYAAVRDRLQTDFHRMIFVDDKSRNVSAASELGIFSIVFNCSGNSDSLTKNLKLHS